MAPRFRHDLPTLHALIPGVPGARLRHGEDHQHCVGRKCSTLQVLAERRPQPSRPTRLHPEFISRVFRRLSDSSNSSAVLFHILNLDDFTIRV